MADLEEIVEKHRACESDGSRDGDERNSTKQKGSKKRRSSCGSQKSSRISSSSRIPEESLEQDKSSNQEDHRAEFYDDYQRVAKEHDKEFLKNRKEDLDTLLIFAGLFSAVATTLITQTESQLQPDSGDETNALLRLLLYKIDNTTFGSDVPTLPSPPVIPFIMYLAQLVLFLSLALSLLCASLAILCKHWLNRYAWTDMEGSVIEHGQNRQGKLDGIHGWYFLYVMDFLQFMLQSSLVLFSVGLLASLWDTNPAAVGAIVAVILFGIFIFISVSIAGVVSDNCPYQTTASFQPRGLWERVRSIVYPKTTLELRSISWVLQTSLNEATRLSALKYLMSIQELPQFNPALVENCFHVFIGCISLVNDKVVIRKGSEQLATMSARCFFRTFHQLSVTHPTSSALKDLRRCYNRIFPHDTDFRNLPFHDTITMVHISIKKRLGPGPVEWDNNELSPQERIPLAWYMAKAAQAGYEETKRKKVPRWTLRFALDSLSLNPPSPPSVVADCLEIVAIELDCDISNMTTMDKSVRVEQVSNIIREKLKIMVEAINPAQIISKRKAISALFPYAISQGQGGHQGMADEILRATAIPIPRKFMWHRMEALLFAESSPPSLNRATTLVSPYLPWSDAFYDQHAVQRWATAALAVEYTEEVVHSVVDVLLQIASDGSLRPHIPDDAWVLLKRQASLPPVCRGRSLGTGLDVFHYIRGLGDSDILKSYYLLVWSEWDFLSDFVIDEMEMSIKEDFCGIEMWGHRNDLIERLVYVLAQLEDRESGHPDQDKPGVDGNAIEQAKDQYKKLRDVLMEVDAEAMETLTRTSPLLEIVFDKYTDSRGRIQDLT